MEYLLNHINLCSLIFHGATTEAINTMAEFLQNDSRMDSAQDLRTYLFTLNYSIYNYILVQEQVSLHQCCLDNTQVIRSCSNRQEAIVLGKRIIHSYSFCKDYLIECHSHPTIKKSLYYIHENISTEITLKDVSDHVNLNPQYFCTLFKKHMNYCLNDYINQKRVNLAKTLIQTSSLSLDIISCKCGYNSYPYFCTIFKKFTGVTPSEYKQQ